MANKVGDRRKFYLVEYGSDDELSSVSLRVDDLAEACVEMRRRSVAGCLAKLWEYGEICREWEEAGG